MRKMLGKKIPELRIATPKQATEFIMRGFIVRILDTFHLLRHYLEWYVRKGADPECLARLDAAEKQIRLLLEDL